jgi:hypothetical protein
METHLELFPLKLKRWLPNFLAKPLVCLDATLKARGATKKLDPSKQLHIIAFKILQIHFTDKSQKAELITMPCGRPPIA